MKLTAFQALFAVFCGVWICALVALAGCVQVQYSDHVMINQSLMGTATVPVQVGPGGLPGLP